MEGRTSQGLEDEVGDEKSSGGLGDVEQGPVPDLAFEDELGHETAEPENDHQLSGGENQDHGQMDGGDEVDVGSTGGGGEDHELAGEGGEGPDEDGSES